MKTSLLFSLTVLVFGPTLASEKPDQYRVTIINGRQMPISVTATSNGKTLYQNRILGKKSV